MGRKISNILKGEIVSSIFYIALGLCLLLIPDQTVNIICKVIFGLIMIAAVCIMLEFMWLRKRKQRFWIFLRE